MTSDIERLKNSLTVRKPILFIGAGFSCGALCKGKELPIGEKLREEIFDIFYKTKRISDEEKQEVEEMSLQELCKVIQREGRGTELKKYLIDRFQMLCRILTILFIIYCVITIGIRFIH